MKISKNVHLNILTVLIVLSAGAIPAAILGYFFNFDLTMMWFNREVPINMMVFTWAIFIASFMRKTIYKKLEYFIYGENKLD